MYKFFINTVKSAQLFFVKVSSINKPLFRAINEKSGTEVPLFLFSRS